MQFKRKTINHPRRVLSSDASPAPGGYSHPMILAGLLTWRVLRFLPGKIQWFIAVSIVTSACAAALQQRVLSPNFTVFPFIACNRWLHQYQNRGKDT